MSSDLLARKDWEEWKLAVEVFPELCEPIEASLVDEGEPGDQAASAQAVFRPLASINWPQYCVRCMARGPTGTITVTVYSATRLHRGASVGALAGGILGGVVGIVIAAGLGDGQQQTSKYKVPICPACLPLVPRADIKGLKIDNADSSPRRRVDFPVLRRQVDKGHVILTFANGAYALALCGANPTSVFSSMDACLAAEQMAKRVKKLEKNPDKISRGQEPSLPAEALRIGTASFEQAVIELLREQLPQDGLFVPPHVPQKKLNTACPRYGMPPGEGVLGLIDCTIFGSAKIGLLFGRERIYFHGGGGGSPSARPGSIAYCEFPGRVFDTSGIGGITLGGDVRIDASGSSVPKKTILFILESIRQMVIKGMS